MLINRRNALMAGKRLPYDTEVEYLESTGTQYIDTGVVWKSVTTAKMEATAQYTQTSSRQITCGAGSAFYFGCNANRWEWRYNGYTGTVGTDVTTIVKEVTSAETRFYINGSLAGTLTQSASQAWWGSTAYVFGLNNGGAFTLPSSVRVYGFKIWIDGVLVFDAIPVRKGTVGYLYDRVTRKLFGNAGTGDFVLGPDVVPMTWQDGLQYNNVGTPIESATSSVGLDYIPITAGHSFTWRLGYGSSASADLIIYNANKERIDYWVARDRTVTISGAAAYMRISALTSYKEQATVYDETAQKYVFANGVIPIGDAS